MEKTKSKLSSFSFENLKNLLYSIDQERDIHAHTFIYFHVSFRKKQMLHKEDNLAL